MNDKTNKEYVKNCFGQVFKISEHDPVMIKKMAMMGALYRMTNKEVEEWKRQHE